MLAEFSKCCCGLRRMATLHFWHSGAPRVDFNRFVPQMLEGIKPLGRIRSWPQNIMLTALKPQITGAGDHAVFCAGAIRRAGSGSAHRGSCQIDNDDPKYGDYDKCVNPSLAADVIGVSDQSDAIGRSVFCVAISICVAVFKCAAIAVAVPRSHRFDNGGKVMRATLSIQMTELVQYILRFSNHLMIRDRN